MAKRDTRIRKPTRESRAQVFTAAALCSEITSEMMRRLVVPLAASAASALALHGAAGPRMLQSGHGNRALCMAAGRGSELDELKFLVGDKSAGSLYDFSAANAAGETVAMSAYKGKAVLIVNVASL